MVVIEVQRVHPLCVCNIYMPSRNSKGNNRNDDNFQSCLDQIEEVLNTYSSTHASLIVGDFNASSKECKEICSISSLRRSSAVILLDAFSLVLQRFTTQTRLIVPKLIMFCSIYSEESL